MTPARSLKLAPRQLPRRSPVARRGFTLTELLIVVGIIVLVVTIALPAFNLISGNRSVDAAQNHLAAIIGRARQEALGIQDFRGVVIFRDPNTSRYAAAQVYYPDPNNPAVIELTPTEDEILLPVGISAVMIQDNGSYGPLGVLMFNAQGQFTSIKWTINTTNSGPGFKLGKRISPISTDFASTPITNVTSSFGFILLPTDGLRNNLNANSGAVTGTYLSDNGIAFLINRYSGTLLRSE